MAARDLPFVALLVATGLLLLYLGRSLTFWFDEWRSMASDGGLVDYFRPANEHWVTLHLLLYRATFAAVGLSSYVPYLAALLTLHLAAVAGAYVLMRRRLGVFAATVLSVPLLLLGAGAENLFWAFQTTFVGSVAFGIWALVALEGHRRHMAVLASLLLVGAVMWSGIGLVFVACVAVRAVADPDLRARTLAVAPPVLLYVAWHVTLGGEAVGAHGQLAGPVPTAEFVFRAIGHSIAALTGLRHFSSGVLGGLLIFAALCAFTLRVSRRESAQRSLALAAAAAIVVQYILIGVVRASHEHDFVETSRYVYVTAFFLAIWIVDLMPHGSDLMKAVRRRPARAIAPLCLFVWVAAVSFNELANENRQARYRADVTRAIIEFAIENEDADWIEPDVAFNLMPAVRDIPAYIRKHGSPLDDVLVPGSPPQPSPRARLQARRLLEGELN